MTITTFSNLYISIMAWSGKMSNTITCRNISLTKICQQLFIIELTIELIYLWKFCFKIVFVSL